MNEGGTMRMTNLKISPSLSALLAFSVAFSGLPLGSASSFLAVD